MKKIDRLLQTYHVGICKSCGKQSFESRKAARQAAKKRFPGEPLFTYRCGDYFHFGHTPTAVREGLRDRNRT